MEAMIIALASGLLCGAIGGWHLCRAVDALRLHKLLVQERLGVFVVRDLDESPAELLTAEMQALNARRQQLLDQEWTA